MRNLFYMLLLGLLVSPSVSMGARGDTFGAEFRTLKECLSGLENAIGRKLIIVTDKPTSVAGYTSNSMWGCSQERSGTKGVYWKGHYTER
jgi:hypothetical protein